MSQVHHGPRYKCLSANPRYQDVFSQGGRSVHYTECHDSSPWRWGQADYDYETGGSRNCREREQYAAWFSRQVLCHERNRGIDPHRMKEGDEIYIPEGLSVDEWRRSRGQDGDGQESRQFGGQGRRMIAAAAASYEEYERLRALYENPQTGERLELDYERWRRMMAAAGYVQVDASA